MRDIFLFILLGAPLLLTLKKPQVGILLWLWVSVMNPHRESFGWIKDFPVLDVIAAITLLSCLLNASHTARAEWRPPLTWLLVFYIWCCLTTLFGISLQLHIAPWVQFSKTMIFCMMMLLYMNRKHWIIAAVAVFTLAILHTGVKGGVYTIASGGAGRIYGPQGTAWGDNNGVSIAMLIVMPLAFALRHLASNRAGRLAAAGSTLLSFLALLGTQSRGGLVGLAGQALFTVYRSNKKVPVAIGLVIALGASFAFMPDKWRDRMGSITVNTEELDSSASNRIIQWYYAIDIANQRPFFGSGFNSFYYKPYYYEFVAHLDTNRAVHSNYFEVIGEQGYVGFIFYCIMWLTFLMSSEKYARLAMPRDDLVWAGSLLKAVQLSFAGYAFNGLTVNMAYLDLPYFLLVFSVLLQSYVRSQIEETATAAAPMVRKTARAN